MPRLTRFKMYPAKARNGADNGNYKHGGWSKGMTPEERKRCDDDAERYLKAYPYLKEPVAFDMLIEALKIKNVRIPRLEKFVDDSNTEFKDSVSAMKLLEGLQRTLALYFARLGITFQSRQRRKEPKTVKSPMEVTEDKE